MKQNFHQIFLQCLCKEVKWVVLILFSSILSTANSFKQITHCNSPSPPITNSYKCTWGIANHEVIGQNWYAFDFFLYRFQHFVRIKIVSTTQQGQLTVTFLVKLTKFISDATEYFELFFTVKHPLEMDGDTPLETKKYFNDSTKFTLISPWRI